MKTVFKQHSLLHYVSKSASTFLTVIIRFW